MIFLERHGCLVTCLRCLFTCLKDITPTGLYLHHRKKEYINENIPKTPAKDQDCAFFILHVLAPIVILLVGWHIKSEWLIFVQLLACYLLIDNVVYFSNVLWFDDLGEDIPHNTPQMNKNSKKVWSHRRLFFVAVISYFESIALFALLHHVNVSDLSFLQTLQKSFEVATGFERPEGFSISIMINLQIMLSFFYATVVISTLSSAAYKRVELA